MTETTDKNQSSNRNTKPRRWRKRPNESESPQHNAVKPMDFTLVRLFWDCIDEEITVRVDEDPTNHSLSPDKASNNVMSVAVRLTLGYHDLVFCEYENPVYNKCYPKSDSGHNYIVVEEVPVINQLDLMKDSTGEEVLLHQFNYWFGNEAYYRGSDLDRFARSSDQNGWVSFTKIRTFPMLDLIFSRFNINPSNEDLCQLLQSSDLVKADPEKGIRRLNKSIPSKLEVESRKIAIFPLKHTNEVFDILDLLSDEYTISSFVSLFKKGCPRLVLTLASHSDAVALNSLETLTFDDRKHIVRFEYANVEEKLEDSIDETQSPTSNKSHPKSPKRSKKATGKKQKEKKTRIRTFAERMLKRTAQQLPILSEYNTILNRLSSERFLTVIAATGSGKTTQLPQYLAEKFSSEGKVVCTQPRAVAALSLAERIAEEFDGTSPGYNVGFEVGGKKVKGDQIMLMTDGQLIKKAAKDILLSDVSVLIIDEAHERSLDTDLVLGIAKVIFKQRSDFRVVISSATIDPSKFLHFFYDGNPNCPPPLECPGRLFEIGIDEKPMEASAIIDELPLIVHQAMHNDSYYEDGNPSGHVLVFMSSIRDIEDSIQDFQRLCDDLDLTHIDPKPLHGKLTPEEQKEVLTYDLDNDDVTDGTARRMVCFCTNVAETSLTVPGIKLVIDTGLAKEARFDPVRRLTLLSEVLISKSSADQRKGRAGRLCSGFCLRLFKYDELTRAGIEPEILRSSLEFVCLKLLMLRQDPCSFHFIDAPSSELLQSSVDLLSSFECISPNKEVTPVGRFFFDLPLDVRMSYFVYLCAKEGYLKEAADLAAILTAPGSIFFHSQSTQGKRTEVRLARQEEAAKYDSDLIYVYDVYHKWSKVLKEKLSNVATKYARDNQLNNRICNNVRTSASSVCKEFKRFPLISSVEQLLSSVDQTTFRDVLSKTLPICFEEQICQFIESSIPTKYDLFVLKSGLKGRIDRGSCFSSMIPAVKFALAYSIVDLEVTTIVQQLHPLPEEFLPKSLLDKVYDHSLVKVTRTIRENIGPFALGALRRALKDRLSTESRSSLWHFVDLLYDDATLKVSAPQQVDQSVVDWSMEIVRDEFLNQSNQSRTYTLFNSAVQISNGLEVLSIERPGPTLVVKRPVNDSRDKFKDFCIEIIGVSLVTKISNNNKNPIQFQLSSPIKQRQSSVENYDNYKRGFVVFPHISDEVYKELLGKFEAAGVMDDVSEIGMHNLYGRNLTLKSTLSLSKILDMFPKVKVFEISPATLIVSDFPSSTQVYDLRNYLGQGFKLIRKERGGSVQITIQCESKSVNEAIAKLQECPLFTQAHDITFTNRSGNTVTKSTTAKVFKTFPAIVSLKFTSTEQSAAALTQLNGQGHPTVFNESFKCEKLPMSLANIINTVQVPEVSITERNSRLSLESQSLAAIAKAANAVKDIINPMKMYFNTLEQRYFIQEVRNLKLHMDWANEFDLDVQIKKQSFNYSVLVRGSGINQGKFVKALNNYHAHFSERFKIISMGSKQKSLFQGKNSLFDKWTKTVDPDLQSLLKMINYEFFISSVIIYQEPDSTDTITEAEEFLDSFFSIYDVSSDCANSCVFCDKVCRSPSVFHLCGHTYCRSCLKDVANALKSSSDDLCCPKCLSSVSIRDLVPLFDRRMDFMMLLENVVINSVENSDHFPDITICKNHECKAIIPKVSSYSFCSKCGTGQCTSCGCYSDHLHLNLSCEEYLECKKSMGDFLQQLYSKAEEFVQEQWNIQPTLVQPYLRNPYLPLGAPVVQKFAKVVKKHGGIACIDKVVFAWHGTKQPAVEPIAYEGFNPGFRRGQAQGPGEYFGHSQNPSVSVGYSSNCRYMFVAAILPFDGVFSSHSNVCFVVNNPIDFESTYCLPVLILEMQNSIPHEPVLFRELTPTPFEFENLSVSSTPQSRSIIPSVAQWYWQDDSGFKPYSDEMSRQIESQYGKYQINLAGPSFVSETVSLNDDQPQSYTIDFDSNQQINNNSGDTRAIKRELVSVSLDSRGVWYFKENSSWIRYDELCQEQVEQAFSNYINGTSAVVSLTFPGRPETYLLDFSQGTQTNTTSGVVSSIKRDVKEDVGDGTTFNFKVDNQNDQSEDGQNQLLKLIEGQLSEMIVKTSNDSESDFVLIFDTNESTFILTLGPSLSSISPILFSVVYRCLKSQGVSVFVTEDEANDGISNLRLRNLLSGIIPTKMDRDGVMQYLAYILVWNCNCTIFGAYVRDFLVRNWKANGIDVIVSSTQSLDDTIGNFKNELQFSNFNPVFRDLPMNNNICKSIDVSIGNYQIQVEFTTADGLRQLDNSAPPYVEADVSNLILNKSGLGFKEPGVQEEKSNQYQNDH
ncbi:hypothetical protein GEMRC1_012124 [Eukaryota sp. GEM-RC1]